MTCKKPKIYCFVLFFFLIIGIISFKNGLFNSSVLSQKEKCNRKY